MLALTSSLTSRSAPEQYRSTVDPADATACARGRGNAWTSESSWSRCGGAAVRAMRSARCSSSPTRRSTWGLDIVWLAEMLVNPARSVLSAPLLVASWIVARTKRLRVGTAVQLLPLNHPLRVAGEVTTLDHLSQGRFDFGIGRSGCPRAYDALGGSLRGESGALLRGAGDHSEGLEGRALQLRGQVLSLRQRHRHAPPVSAAASAGPDGRDDARDVSPRRPDGTAHLRGAARHEHSRAGGTPEAYRAAWREAGHPGDGDVCLRIPVYAAPTEKAALEEPRRDHHLLLPAPGRSDPRAARTPRHGPGRAARSRRPSSCRLSRTRRSSTPRSPSAPRRGLIDRLGELRDELS